MTVHSSFYLLVDKQVVHASPPIRSGITINQEIEKWNCSIAMNDVILYNRFSCKD